MRATRRCRPKATRIGTPGLLHSRSAMTWQTQNRAWLLYLPMTQRGVVFCPAKTEGCMAWIPVNDAMTQGGHGFSAWAWLRYLPMTQGRHDILLHRTAASELDPISENPLGVCPRALLRASSVCLGARGHRGGALSSASSPHQKYRRSRFVRAPSRSHFGDNFLRRHRLALVSRLGSSRSWLRQSCFEAQRKIARKVLMCHLIVVPELTLNVCSCSLTRATGPFTSHGSFCFVKENGRAPVSERSGVEQIIFGPAL